VGDKATPPVPPVGATSRTVKSEAEFDVVVGELRDEVRSHTSITVTWTVEDDA